MPQVSDIGLVVFFGAWGVGFGIIALGIPLSHWHSMLKEQRRLKAENCEMTIGHCSPEANRHA
jgi:hypothetical protein